MALNISRPQRPGWLADFQAFIMRGNVVDLAVGIIIGAAFTTIVQSLVKDIFNPLIGLLVGGIDFSNLFLTLRGPVEHTVADAQKAGAVTINYGIFINACIQFLIVSFAVFRLVRMLTKLHVRREAVAADPPAPTTDQVLLGEIRDLLRDRRPLSPGATGGPAAPVIPGS